MRQIDFLFFFDLSSLSCNFDPAVIPEEGSAANEYNIKEVVFCTLLVGDFRLCGKDLQDVGLYRASER